MVAELEIRQISKQFILSSIQQSQSFLICHVLLVCMFICDSHVKPLSTFRSLRIKVPNLYHILAFSTESVKKTTTTQTCAALGGRQKTELTMGMS